MERLCRLLRLIGRSLRFSNTKLEDSTCKHYCMLESTCLWVVVSGLLFRLTCLQEFSFLFVLVVNCKGPGVSWFGGNLFKIGKSCLIGSFKWELDHWLQQNETLLVRHQSYRQLQCVLTGKVSNVASWHA